MKISIEVKDEYLLELIDKNFDKPKFESVDRLDLIKEEIFNILKNLRNDIIIREGYNGFNSNAYFTIQIRCAWAKIIKEICNENKSRK